MWPFSKLRRALAVTDADWRHLLASRPVFAGLAPEDESRLRRLTERFLREKSVVGAHHADCADAMRLAVAAMASLPILNLGLDWYRHWRTVILYPDQFVGRHQTVDEIGVAHEWDETMSGESWERGPVVLSWADVEASGFCDGYNVVIHEMAHQLDQLNGSVNGFPPLHRGMDKKLWTEVFSTAFEALNDALTRSEPVAIDEYAAESPGEFFAVISEYFFEQPVPLKREFSAVYDQLTAFYRQDPARRLDGRS